MLLQRKSRKEHSEYWIHQVVRMSDDNMIGTDLRFTLVNMLSLFNNQWISSVTQGRQQIVPILGKSSRNQAV